MRTTHNEVTQKHEWVLENWAEKTMYVLAVAYFIFLGLCFAMGVVIGLTGGN